MHRLRLRILPLSAALAVAFSCALPSLTVAKEPPHCQHLCPQPLVPGKSIGPVHLGEPESQVHLGPSESHQPGSFFYRDYSLGVAYRNRKAVAIVLGGDTNPAFQALAEGGYETHTHPIVGVGRPVTHVPSAYPQAKCQHYILNAPGGTPDLVTEDCVLDDPHNHSGTFFGGEASKPGPPTEIGVIIVAIASVVPHLPSCASNPVPLC